MLLTFGAMFPPLAVALAVTVFAVAFFNKIKVGRFIGMALEQQLQKYINIVESECEGVGSPAVLHNSMWMLITISCCFYTLFLFDTLGDSVGFGGAYWVLIVVPLMPFVLYCLYTYYSYHVAEQQSASTGSSKQAAMESPAKAPEGSDAAAGSSNHVNIMSIGSKYFDSNGSSRMKSVNTAVAVETETFNVLTNENL